MEAEKIQALKGFVECYELNPHVLHTPSLAFFKNFLQSLGAPIPAFRGSVIYIHELPFLFSCIDEAVVNHVDSKGYFLIVFDVANLKWNELTALIYHCLVFDGLDLVAKECIVEPDNDPPQKVTTVFIRLKKPNAAIRDADAALQVRVTCLCFQG
ncbi:hypothetical protein SASPL_136537 [Salvia splendens]|uniref:Hsp70-interacting protein N-terminal domain-containing protein n=1 Tax=Salvia splendens TaxID=180675 RepID=A0A8X8ZGS9_SALSN|nr:hypothetical protein SASPL_136537 [Salvia splendens]